MIWIDSIFWSLAMWVAEKIPKLWRKDQPFASDVSTNTARDATLRSVVFAVTSTPFGRLCLVQTYPLVFIAEFILLALHSLFSKEFNTKDIVLFYLASQRFAMIKQFMENMRLCGHGSFESHLLF